MMNLHPSFRRASGAALFASAMMLASSQASATCGMSIPSPTSTVTAEGAATYAYAYTLHGEFGSCVSFYGPDNFTINSFEVPYFADAGITAITSPAGWSAHIDPTDAFGLAGAQTLVWTAISGFGVVAGTDESSAAWLSGFGYTATETAVYGPSGYLTGSSSLLDIVDPALPASPQALADGLVPTTFPSASSVPEPSMLLTMLAGCGLIAAARRRRA